MLPAPAKGPSRRVSIASLVAFRILFGLTMLVSTVRFVARGWVDSLYLEPTYHFTYWGFSWVQPWPAFWMYMHFILLGVCALCICIGFYYRLAAAVFFLSFTYIELLDQATYLNHYYLVSLLSMLAVFLPLHANASLDAKRRPNLRRTHVPALYLWVIRGQVALVYLFAGAAKLQRDWLVEANPLAIWLKAHTGLAWVGAWLGRPEVARAMSVGGAVFDLAIVFLLLWRRTQTPALLALCGFHTITGLLFPIGVFPWLMTACALILLPPTWPQGLLERVGLWWSTTHPNTHASAPSRVCMLAFSVYATIQVALPLRHHLYPGDVAWTEEGGRFAWRVMLTEKVGDAVFRVHNPATGATWRVRPEAYLTPLQAKEMCVQPDMLLAFARFLGAREAMPVEVYVDAFVSLNGRPATRLVDPTVNLMKQHEAFAPKTWLLPAPH